MEQCGSDDVLRARIAALAQLGAVLRALGEGLPWPGHAIGLAEGEYAQLESAFLRARQHNGWSTEENVRFASLAWGQALSTAAIEEWVSRYPALACVPDDRAGGPRVVGLVLAGNVPLVGLHDVLCTWLSGHRARVKCSAQEPELIPAL
ncbi:MAG: hypothetical protein ACK4L7_06640, partial [Flavobacteriales bacterium]